MIQFKTKYTSITVDGVFIIDRKGKSPLHDEILCIHCTDWKVKKDSIFFKVGAYCVDIKVENNDSIVELIKQHFRNPLDFMLSDTIIHCKAIEIKEN